MPEQNMEYDRYFFGADHRQRFTEAVKKLGAAADEPTWKATLFLLTADEERWLQAENYIDWAGLTIDWDNLIDDGAQGPYSPSEIQLLKIAQELFNYPGYPYISLRWTDLSMAGFEQAWIAFLVRRLAASGRF